MKSDYHNQLMEESYSNAMNQGEGQDPNSLYADYLREEKVRNIIEQINPDYLLEDIEHRIRGQLKDRMTQEWKGETRSKISEELITNYISFLGSILNQNTSLSNFSTQEINNLIDNIINYISHDLSDNSEKYGFVKKKVVIIKRISKKVVEYYEEDMIKTRYEPIEITEEIEVERVTDYNEMTRVGNIILMSCYAVFKRAQNGMEAQRIFKHLNISENINPQGQKKGMMDFLKFWQ